MVLHITCACANTLLSPTPFLHNSELVGDYIQQSVTSMLCVHVSSQVYAAFLDTDTKLPQLLWKYWAVIHGNVIVDMRLPGWSHSLDSLKY